MAGAGRSFSSGHDIGTDERQQEAEPGPEQHPTYQINGANRASAEQKMLGEWHHFFQNTLRWRNLRKITIAQVQGAVTAAGLTLCWSCDLIVGAEDTVFSDPVGTRLGMCGVEYFAHPWEFGPRKAKELLLTGDSIDVHEAHRLGMVSRVHPNDELAERTLELARDIAARPSMTSLLIKEAVNQTQDMQGFYNSLQAAFTIHQLNHSHWAQLHDDREPRAKIEDGAVDWRTFKGTGNGVKGGG
jgi:enoyl-CoA hydratase